jgi:hypothetical protein
MVLNTRTIFEKAATAATSAWGWEESTGLRRGNELLSNCGAAVLKLHRTADYRRTRIESTGSTTHERFFTEPSASKLSQLDQSG